MKTTFLRDASVSTKLSFGFGLTLALFIAVGLFGVQQLYSLNSVTSEITSVWFPRVQMLGEMKRLVSEHRLSAMRRTQTTDFRQLAAIETDMQTAAAAMLDRMRAYGRISDSPEERALFVQFQSLWSAYRDSLTPVFHRLETGDVASALADFEQVSLRALTMATERLETLVDLSNQRSAAAANHATRVYAMAQSLTVAAIAIAALCALLGIMWITRKISEPILRISEAMHGLTQGDRTKTIDVDRSRKDEVGMLAAAFRGYRDSLERGEQMTKLADLERERLKAAARNMQVGFCMFDAERRLVLSNQRYAEIYGLPPHLTEPGTHWEDIVRFRIATGLYVGQDPEKYLEQLTTVVERRERFVDLVELRNGRSINLIHQPLPEGGWLTTHHDITDLRKSEARIIHMARHDSLTDLPNRLLFRERAEEALAARGDAGVIAVLCLDLDHFKTVNDTLGHPIGDALLKRAAERLRQCTRDTDTVARIGGDEFAIVQVDTEQPVGATALAQRVIESMSEPFLVDDHQLIVGASVGIAIAPTDGDSVEPLLKNGDMALYRAKADGRGTYRFFEPEMDARMQARRLLELDLRKALAAKELELFYQPMINLETGEISGFEALLRWHHPLRGLVAPAEFVPLAEEIGVIVPIGEWVIHQACHDAAGWPEPVKVAVNLSAVQFRSARLLSAVVQALANSGLPAQRLEFEITESVLLADTDATLATLHQLQSLGVEIAMDDFGTGYSSLSYLRSFPFDRIKIDQSFINDACDTDSSVAIIRAVTGLGSSLGMATTAEGVETEAQLDRVRAEGCTEAQGFLLSKPVPVGEVAAMLAGSRAQQPVRAAAGG